MSEVERLRIELATVKEINDRYSDELRARDVAAIKAPAEINHALQYAQRSAAAELSNPKYVEEHRAIAWGAKKFLVDRPPEYYDGGWPEGLTAEIAVNRFFKMNDDGKALAGEPEPEPEKPAPLSPWLVEAINKAKAREGK